MKTRSYGSWLVARATFLGALLFFPAISLASDPIPAPKQKHPIALTGGKVYTVSGLVIEKGTVVFDKGKITAVGADVKVPEGAEQIDVTGKSVYPGMISAFSNIGLTEIGSVRGTLDMSETGDINPNVRAEAAFHPESELIPVARSGGITVAVSTPVGGLIAGTSAAMMMDGWTWEDMRLKAPIGLLINWPAMVWRPNPFSRQTKEEWQKRRDDQLKKLKDAFASARAYRLAKQAE